MVLAGTALNASLLGAKTVKGPPLFRVAVKPAWVTKVFRVLRDGVLARVWARSTGAGRVAQPTMPMSRAAASNVRRPKVKEVLSVMVFSSKSEKDKKQS